MNSEQMCPLCFADAAHYVINLDLCKDTLLTHTQLSMVHEDLHFLFKVPSQPSACSIEFIHPIGMNLHVFSLNFVGFLSAHFFRLLNSLCPLGALLFSLPATHHSLVSFMNFPRNYVPIPVHKSWPSSCWYYSSSLTE